MLAKLADDVEGESYVLISKARLTRNEYSATVRNKVENNRLKVLNQYMNDQNDIKRCKYRTSINNLKRESNQNQRVVCSIKDYFISRPLLLFGRQKLANVAGSSPSQQTLTKVRLRIVQQVFNNRRVVYRNRVATNRQNLLLSSIENAHQREQATQRLQKRRILSDLKKANLITDSCLTVLPSYPRIDLTESKELYRFGIRVQSATPYGRTRPTDARSDSTRKNPSARIKSASTSHRPLTAPPRTFPNESYIDHEDAESDDDDDDETIPSSDSRLTSAKQQSTTRLTSGASNSFVSHQSSNLSFDNLNLTTSNAPSPPPPPSNYRITWPVQLKVFAVQDEDEHRQQFLAWRADLRNGKPRRTSNQFQDPDLEKKYQESIRRRREIEAFVTPENIEEHQLNDPVFAKRYRQLKLAIRAGKTPIYDPHDREIRVTTNKSKIERTRTALITATQNKVKSFYQNQQKINDAKLSKRVDHFLKRLATFKQDQESQEELNYFR